MKTFKEILEQEFKNQSFAVSEMEAELERLSKQDNANHREVVKLMNELFEEKRVLRPIKKIFEAYKKQMKEEE